MDEKQIIEVIENSLNLIGSVKGFIEKIEHKYLKGYICRTVDFVGYNTLNGAQIPSGKIDETIQEMVNFYASANLTKMGWFVTPSTEPTNLSDYLLKKGFKETIATLGMIRSVDEELDIKIADNFEYREVSVEEYQNDAEIGSMVEMAYGMPDGTSTVFGKIISSFEKSMLNLFVAYSEDKPVAFSRLIYIPNTSIGFLGGAATLPEYRKQGIYSAMLKKRFDRAKNKGIEYLLILANEETSAPVAEKNGFRKVCRIPTYIWQKESTG